MVTLMRGYSSKVQSSLCRARPPELLGVHMATENEAEQSPEQGCVASSTRASCSSIPNSSTLVSYTERDSEILDALREGVPSPVGCSSLLSELGAIVSSQTEDVLSFSATETLPRMTSSMRTVEEDQPLPTWESVCVDIGILVGLLAADLLHFVNLGEQFTGLCFLVFTLYIVLVLVLLLFRICGCWCSCCQYRAAWFLIITLHAAIGLTSGLWREQGASAAYMAGVLQYLAIVLYPVDIFTSFLVSLGLVPTFIAFQVMRTSPAIVVIEGILVLVAIGVGACIICVTVGTISISPASASASLSSSATAAIFSFPMIMIQRASSRSRSWRESTSSCSTDIQTLFAPIFVGDSNLLTPQSWEDADVLTTTRLDRLVSRLAATKENIERGSLDSKLRRVLMSVLGFLLKELKDVSSLHLVPMEELTIASPMTAEYVRKTLNQQGSYEHLTAPSSPCFDEKDTEHTSDPRWKRRRSLSFQKFMEEQSKPSRIPTDSTLERASTKDSNDLGVAANAGICRRDFMNTLWMGSPETPTTFDQAISAMMTCLTFCEHWDDLPPPHMSSELQTMLSLETGSWSFDVFKLSKLCENRPLVVVGEYALRHLVTQMGLQAQKVSYFLSAIEARYHSTNMYHNSMHAADVMNSAFYFLYIRSVRMAGFEAIEQLSSLIAASAHDVGHNSKANRYHTVAETPLAMLFNDQSVLENMHCAMTFAVLHGEAANFISIFDAPLRNAFRSLVLQQILDTDLAKHIQMVSRFRQEFLNKDVGEEHTHDAKQLTGKPSLTACQRKELLCFLLKSADVSGSTKPFDLHVQWTMRINTEFFDQGDVERDLGLPCSPFCDRHGTNLAESQRGFFDFIVAPLYSALDEYVASRRLRLEVIPELERNRAFWKGFDGLTFDYSNPMSNGDTLRRAFISGFAQQSDEDDKADAFNGRKTQPGVSNPTLLSFTCSQYCKARPVVPTQSES